MKSISALSTSREHPFATSPQRLPASEIYGPAKPAPQPVDRSKFAGMPSSIGPIQRAPRVGLMSNDRPTYRIIQRNEAIPGRESASDLIYGNAYAGEAPTGGLAGGHQPRAQLPDERTQHVLQRPEQQAPGPYARGEGHAGEHEYLGPLRAAPAYRPAYRPECGVREQPHGEGAGGGDEPLAEECSAADEVEARGPALGAPPPQLRAAQVPRDRLTSSSYAPYVPKPRNPMPLGNTSIVFGGGDQEALAKTNHARRGFFSAQPNYNL